VTDEEALFDVWYTKWERDSFLSVPQIPFYLRPMMLAAWSARASLHVVKSQSECPTCGDWDYKHGCPTCSPASGEAGK